MSRTPHRVRAAGLLLALLAGCGGAGTAETGTPSALLELSTSGGISGRTSRVVVDRDGRVQHLSDRQPTVVTTLGPDAVAELERAVDEAHLEDLDRSYGRVVPDGIRYELTTRSGTVVIENGPAPDRLTALLARVDALAGPTS